MDADLQDPPEVIPQMVELWKQGNHIVYGVRRSRDGETLAKRFTSWMFYRLLNRLADVSIPEDAGDFRLMDRKVLDALKRCREQSRFMRALISWTGFKATPLPFDRQAQSLGADELSFLPPLLSQPRCIRRLLHRAAPHRDGAGNARYRFQPPDGRHHQSSRRSSIGSTRPATRCKRPRFSSSVVCR